MLIQVPLDDLPDATPSVAELVLWRDLSCPGCGAMRDDQIWRVREVLTDIDESAVTWNSWQIPGAYGPEDVGPVLEQHVLPGGTTSDTSIAVNVLDVLRAALARGAAYLRVKLEPDCTPDNAGVCITYSNWWSTEAQNIRPVLAVSFDNVTATPIVPPTNTPTLLPTPTHTPTKTATPTATPTGTLTPPTATPTPVPALVISEIVANPNADWNGDGEINERDRGVEICNWTSGTIDFDDQYFLRYNGLPSERFNGIALPGQCFLVWYELSGEQFLPMPTGGTVSLVGPQDLIDVFTYPALASGQCVGRWPDGTNNWIFLDRCSPGHSNGYWLTHPTPTPRPTATP